MTKNGKTMIKLVCSVVHYKFMQETNINVFTDDEVAEAWPCNVYFFLNFSSSSKNI